MRNSTTTYQSFLERRAQLGSSNGFEPVWMPDNLFGFQRYLVEWACRMGRAAIFADCGLGKTPMQLAWAENVARQTGGRVLVLAPLAVAAQTLRESHKFGVECELSRDGSRRTDARIVLTNYEQLHRFKPDDFVAVVADESSILKNYDGVRRALITEFMRVLPYRLLCTATAAPNDYIELGTSSEALGGLGYQDVLTRFFVNDQHSNHPMRSFTDGSLRWRFRGHAEEPFWRWVASWARAVRRPSDLGFEDGAFQLPPLVVNERVVATARQTGMLFPVAAKNMREEREERRATLKERCEVVADLVDHADPAVVWCHLNDEGDLLERLIPGARQVSGAMTDEEKEATFGAFRDGTLRVLITKPKIGAWGLNWEHCSRVVTFASHSYESYYQSVRRCWRFGQRRPVVVDIVTTEGEQRAKENLQRKANNADRMFNELVRCMREAMSIERNDGVGTLAAEVPAWLS
jgi:hypothetical protein